MKKTLLTLSAILILVFSQAQEEGFVFTDFEPDLNIEALTATDYGDTIKIDLDQDGAPDFKMYIGVVNSTLVRYVFVCSSWYFRYCANSIYSYGYVDEYDTLVSEPHQPAIWHNPNSVFELIWEPDGTHYMEIYMGFRKIVEGENYYAWARIYMYRNLNGQGYHPQHGYFDIVTAYCDKMVYCTIPNYPLRWGQTNLYDNLEEDASFSFATIHPNPTTGEIVVKGENLKQIEIYDVAGQSVSSLKASDNMVIDLSSQPAGIYFINVTNTEGKKCLRKVVKQ